MEIVGREDEVKILEGLMGKKSAEFLAVYGRRRIGKTYLLRSFFYKNIVFECTALNEDIEDEVTLERQLENFWMCLIQRGHNGLYKPSNWLQAFKELEIYISKLRSKKKKVIFMDEIPWFDTAKSGFLPAFANFWNSYCSKRDDLILVACGSAASWIIDNIVNNTGGLHNRISRTIHLLPFTLQETKAYLRFLNIQLSDSDVVKLHMCIGGIPYYLNGVNPGRSFPQILDDLFFSKNAYMKNEFHNLFSSLFKKHQQHLAVIERLEKKQLGSTRQELVQSGKLSSGGTLTKILHDLEVCGFIAKFNAFNKPKEEKTYRLVDEYIIFYYKFLQNKKVKITGASLGNSHSFKVWSGFAFENLCFHHIDKITQILGINGILFNVYQFRQKESDGHKGLQIDMIIDRSDNCINIIEAKYYDGTFQMSASQALSLKNKVAGFIQASRTKKTIFITLISNEMVDKNMHYLSAVTNGIEVKQLMK